MIDEDEWFTPNSLFNLNVACQNCVFRAKKNLAGKPIPRDKKYECGFCQIYNDIPVEIALYEGECKYKAEE